MTGLGKATLRYLAAKGERGAYDMNGECNRAGKQISGSKTEFNWPNFCGTTKPGQCDIDAANGIVMDKLMNDGTVIEDETWDGGSCDSDGSGFRSSYRGAEDRPDTQWKMWATGCTAAHFMAKGKRENCLAKCAWEGVTHSGNACEASNYVLTLSDSNWKNAKVKDDECGIRDGSGCCERTGLAEKYCEAACKYYFDVLVLESGKCAPGSDVDDDGNPLQESSQQFQVAPPVQGATGTTGQCDKFDQVTYGSAMLGAPAGDPGEVPSGAVVAYGPGGQRIGDCDDWCAAEAKTNCKLSTALVNGAHQDYTLFCGMYSEARTHVDGTCVAMVGRKLAFEPCVT